MMKKVFLFGAGASYGSDLVDTPPLGAGLFDALRRFNPDGWGTISGNLADSFRTDFEAGMKAVSPHTLAPLQRAMAAYFFEFKPRLSSLYVELASRIKRAAWPGAVCTLNYERLLEISLLHAGVQPTVGLASNVGSQVELCLPHGACHLFCDAVRGIAGMISMDGGAIQTNGPITVVGDPQEHRKRIMSDAFPPVMSYFEPSKRTTSGNSFIEGQRARWGELATQASTILVVGVRPRDHDSHIWQPVAASSAKVIYCGGPAGVAEYSGWASRHRKGSSDRILSGFFRDEFSSLCAEAGV